MLRLTTCTSCVEVCLVSTRNLKFNIMNLKYLFGLATLGIVAVACNDINDNIPVNISTDILSVQSEGNQFATRFDGLANKWQKGDAIGVFMLNNDNSQILNDAANIQYITDQNAESVSFKSSVGIPIASENVNFYAYYPFNASVLQDEYIYSVNLGDQDQGYSSYDLMWAKKTGVTPEDVKSSGLSLTFSHQLAMIKVNVTLAAGLSELKNVVVSGLNTSAKFNLIDGTLACGDVLKTVKLYKSAEKTFVGILLPTKTPQNMTLTFYVDDSKYQYTMSPSSNIKELKAGYQYVFNIGLGESVEGNLTEIQGNNTPWGNEEGGENGSAVEVPDNLEIPVDYAQVAVTENTDLNIALQGTNGKIALVFNSQLTYPTIENIMVPETVTELLLINGNEKRVKLNIQGMTLNEGLQRLAFNNLEIEGTSGKSLISNKADSELPNDAIVEFKNCKLYGMKSVCAWDADGGANNSLASFIVDNCQISDMDALFNFYRTKEIKITNSTISKMTQRAIYINTYGVPEPIIHVENCTLVDLNATPLECPSTYGKLIYKNNISDCRNQYKNLAYKMYIIEFSGNYAAVAEDAAILVHNQKVTNEDAWVDTEMERNTLFKDADDGDFTTTVVAGDPRWRTVQP